MYGLHVGTSAHVHRCKHYCLLVFSQSPTARFGSVRGAGTSSRLVAFPGSKIAAMPLLKSISFQLSPQRSRRRGGKGGRGLGGQSVGGSRGRGESAPRCQISCLVSAFGPFSDPIKGPAPLGRIIIFLTSLLLTTYTYMKL